jgi:hypothetical protein
MLMNANVAKEFLQHRCNPDRSAANRTEADGVPDRCT